MKDPINCTLSWEHEDKKTGLTKNLKNGCREISHLHSKTSVLLVQEDDTLKRKEMRFKKEQWLQNKHKNKKNRNEK